VKVEHDVRFPPAGAARGQDDSMLEASFADLADDFDELAHIARSARDRLSVSLGELRRCRTLLQPSTVRTLDDQVQELRSRFAASLDELVTLRVAAARGERSQSSLVRLTERKYAHAELMRSQHGLVGAMVTATDWQSPSFAHAMRSQAGRLTGRITEHHDDYKRDRHADAAEYERAYLDQYVANPSGLDLRALMTGCGMAAFTTILAFLEMEGKLGRPVVSGRSLYHECKQLLRRSRASDRIVWVDEHDVRAQVRAVATLQPGALFIDSMCNAKGIALPDLGRLITLLAAQASDELYLVIDNTALSSAFQPFAMLTRGRRSLRLLVFESLTKYAQLGLDRTPAGMIVAEGTDVADALDGYREHLGTNVPDAVVHAIPFPERSIYERRLARLGRNASLLAEAVQRRAETLNGELFTGACYPGLANHPANAWIRHQWFGGGFFEVGFAGRPDAIRLQHRFVDVVLEMARARGVPIAAGASFGLNTTRVYHTASTSAYGEPFVRISPGTEHSLGIEAVAGVLLAAMDRLALEARQLPRFRVEA